MMDWNKKKERSEKSMKLERIDKILSNINMFRLKPLGFELNTEQYTYQLLIRELQTLSIEVFSEFSQEEIDKDKDFREKINKLLKEKPIHQKGFQDSFSGKKRIVNINNKNWEELEEVLNDYDRFLRNAITTFYKGFSFVDEDTSGVVIEGDDEE